MKVLLLILISNIVYSQCAFLNLGNDITLTCDSCVTTSAVYSSSYQTNQYSITAIPYNPLPYNIGTLYNIPIDDRWSGVLNLPFTFCFFNQSYNQFVLGTNGIISFNLAYANLYCPWPFTVPIPSNNPNPPPGFPRSMIGLYHDIDPSLGGEVRYGVYGSFPCRRYVINFFQVPHYNCPLQRSTFQIVLYEFTNIIEIHIERKQTCGSWNGGRACLGIQNTAGTIAYAPVGRNTANYTINAPEAWRFSPNGPEVSTFNWLNTQNNNPIYSHCYNSDSTLIGELRYNCGNTQISIRDTVNININTTNINLSLINHN
jgi:hypothetical protein